MPQAGHSQKSCQGDLLDIPSFLPGLLFPELILGPSHHPAGRIFIGVVNKPLKSQEERVRLKKKLE